MLLEAARTFERTPISSSGRKESVPPRPKTRLLLLLFSIVLFGGLSLPGAASAAPSFNTGLIDIDAYQEGGSLAFDRTKDAGAKYVKNNLYWGYMVANPESTERPGTPEVPFDPRDPASPYYDWTTYDQLVRNAKGAGLEPVLSPVNAPKWARTGCSHSMSCAPSPKDYADFATAAAKRYSGTFDPGNGEGVLPRVRYWQAWVEPNLYHFFLPIFKNGNPVAAKNYKPLLNSFYNAIHAVDNSNFVMAAGLAPNGVKGKAIAPMTFTRQVLCMTNSLNNPRPRKGCGAPVKADIWAVHPYTTGAPIHFPDNSDNMSVAALPRMVKLINAARRSGHLVGRGSNTPLWATEFSWDSNKPDPGGLSWNLQSRWVAQAMMMMYQANVRTMFWFGLRDEDRGDGSRPWYETFESGLYLRGATTAKDQPKKVLRVFRYPFAAIKTSRGFRYWGRTPNSKPTTVSIWARPKAGSPFRRVAKVRAGANGIFAGNVRGNRFTATGAVKAQLQNGAMSVPFGLNKTKDFYYPPHGRITK